MAPLDPAYILDGPMGLPSYPTGRQAALYHDLPDRVFQTRLPCFEERLLLLAGRSIAWALQKVNTPHTMFA